MYKDKFAPGRVILSPQRWLFVGIFRDFLGIFSRFSNPNPDPRNFGICGFLLSEFFEGFISRSRSPGFRDFRDFLLEIFSGFSGFSDLVQNKNPDPESRNPELNIIYNI